MSKYQADSGESCPVCGDGLVIHTDAPQDTCSCIEEAGYDECQSDDCQLKSWWAFDGDEVICPDCGFKGWVSADAEDAHIAWEDDDEHNVKCYEEYEKREALDNVSTKD
jgi:hypothetical protein